jgi:valyl-tRNA synthetase
MVVERKLAAEGAPSRREMGREDFLKKVWEWKTQSGGTIINQLKRLGASCDWSRNAFTMSGAPGAPAGEEGNFHDAVIKVFVDMYHKGLTRISRPRFPIWRSRISRSRAICGISNIRSQAGRPMNMSRRTPTAL